MPRLADLVLLGGVLLLLGSPARAVDFTHCEEELAAHPNEERTAYCFYALGAAKQDRPEVRHRMRSVLAASPQLAWFSLCLGFLDENGSNPAT
ncbi:MAG TPA: hypothetical protein VIH93_02250, partial [Thermoanaerobaculia bacterium]